MAVRGQGQWPPSNATGTALRFSWTALSPMIWFLIFMYLIYVLSSLGAPPLGPLTRTSVIAATIGIPVAISGITGLVGARIARSMDREVVALVFASSTVIVKVEPSPSRPFGAVQARPINAGRVWVLAASAVLGLALLTSQLRAGAVGWFSLMWLAIALIVWSLFALPNAAMELLVGYWWPEPGSAASGPKFRLVAVLLVVLAVAVYLSGLLKPEVTSVAWGVYSLVRFPAMAGLLSGARSAWVLSHASRVLPRDLRHVAVQATVVTGYQRAGDATAFDQTPGFLIADQFGRLGGWVSREAALRSPDSLLIELARPLADPVPIPALQRTSELLEVFDPSTIGDKVVAIEYAGVPVGYIEVFRGFEYVTGNTAWSQGRSPA